jgi:tartrate-resistant acid phosphatase type 5
MKKIWTLMLLSVLITACGGSPTPGSPSAIANATDTAGPLPVTATFTVAPATLFQPTLTSLPTATLTSAPSETPAPAQVQFGVIGDFGSGDQPEADVARLVLGWNPDFIITVGDNNYPSGSKATIDANIGQFYHTFIQPYNGSYGPGAKVNQFFPTLGNHDWYTTGAQPYLDYFHLPGNERYYDFVWGPVHFFAIDSDENEPDGVNQSSVQAKWLEQAMAGSTSRWNVVYFHYPPYSSGQHGSITWMRWPFAAWGADAVLSGHDHSYERLTVDGLVYFVNGSGGGGLYDYGEILPESQKRYNSNYGAMRVTAAETLMKFEFINRSGTVIDTYELTKP